MKPQESTSVAASAATSPKGQPQQVELPRDSGHPLSEAAYLQEQAANARAALGLAWHGVVSSFNKGVQQAGDPHRLTKKHPIIAVVTATVAGFVTAASLVPSQEQAARNAVEAALKKAREAEEASRSKQNDHNGSRRTESHLTGTEHGSDNSPGFLGRILLELFRTVRPLLMNVLTAGLGQMAAHAAEGSQPPAPAEDAERDEASFSATATPDSHVPADIPVG